MNHYYEDDTNTAVISESLKILYPEVYKPIVDNVKTIEVPTVNIWTRDFMPIQVGNRFVDFRFQGYGLPEFKVGTESRMNEIKHGRTMFSDLNIDGGNIVRSRDYAIICDSVFQNNPALDSAFIIGYLEGSLDCRIIIIPTEPEDLIGHSDGVCHFIPGTKTVLVNYYGDNKLDEYASEVKRILKKAGLETIDINNIFVKAPKTPEKPKPSYLGERKIPMDYSCPGYGYYVNFVIVGEKVFVPQFNSGYDQYPIKELLMMMPTKDIIPVDCSRICWDGGLLNCCVMGYKL